MPPSDNIEVETILEKLRLRATTRPEEVCYAFLEGLNEESHLTARELDHSSRTIAVELLRHAVPGDRILLLLPSGLEFLQSFWACLYAGMIAVPLYPPKTNDKSGKLAHIIADCRPAAAIVLDELATGLVRELDAGKLRFVNLNNLDSTSRVALELPRIGADSVAFLQYSSGSTGNPQGAMISHRNILANLGVLEVATRSCGQDLFVGWLPLFHDMGMVMSILMPMYVGARSILFSPLKFAKNPLFWIQVISRYHATISGAPNFAYDLCARRFSPEMTGNADLSSWRLALSGAEPVRAETISAFCNAYAPLGFNDAAFMPAYGMAEATVFLCGGPLSTPPRILAADAAQLQRGIFAPSEEVSPQPRNLVSCGPAPLGHDIIVVDEFQALAPGLVGEIWARGASVSSGYWGNPEHSQAVFHAYTRDGSGPYLRTGDLGFIEGGELFVLGRIKDVMIVEGRNIHPHDIEDCVRHGSSANATGGAVVFSIDGVGTDKIILVLEVRPRSMGGSYDSVAADIRACVLACFGILISEIVFAPVGSVMKTTSGKVMRRAMRDRYSARSIESLHVSALDLSSEEDAPLSTDTEFRLAKLWENLLGVSDVHANSNFIQLGGNSLTLARLVTDIRSEWKVDLALKRVFERPVLAVLAALIDQDAGSAQAPRAIGHQEATDFAPLSFQQRRLWFLAQMGDDVGANENISLAMRFNGTVDRSALQRSFATLVDRHETLRTRFSLDAAGSPVQSVMPVRAFELTQIDLSASAATDIETALQACTQQEINARFGLTGDLLLRASLLRLTADDHVLLLSVHHIAADGWSANLLVQELSALYNAYVGGRGNPLPPLQIRYRDYAYWQVEHQKSEQFMSGAQYWRNRLTGIPAVHGLPVQGPRKPRGGFCGAALTTSIDAHAANRLRSLCVQNAATLFMGLHAIFAVLLSRYSNETTIVVGTAVANRESAGLHDLIGLFANVVVLRTELSGDPPFCDVLLQSRKIALDAYEHQAFPFEKVVEMLQPQRSLEITPLFQVMMVLQNNERQMADFRGLSVSSVAELDTFAKFDLTLGVAESEQGLRLSWKYDSSLFTAAAIAGIAASFSILVEGIVRSPTSRVSFLPLLSQQDRHHVLNTLNATQAQYLPDECIHELFEKQAEHTPDSTAVIYDGEQLTYAELNQRANRLAHYLRARGVGTEALLGLCVERSLEMIVGLLAILKAGGAYVPLDPGYPRERLAYMVKDSGVQWLLTQEALLQKVRESAGSHTLELLSLDGVELQSRLRVCSAQNPRRGADQSSGNLAYVIYTSGSTGTPKGAMNEHRAVVNRLRWMQKRYALGPQDRVLQKTPFSFDVSVWEFFWPLSTGALLIVARPDGHKDPAYLRRLIQQRGVTRVHFVPSMLQAFLEQCRPGDCACLLQIVCSGEEISAALVRRCLESLPQGRLSNLYGPTEAAVDVTSWECEVQDENTRVPIGRPIANTRIYILDANLQPVPVGVTGEICIGGIAVGRGYRSRPELTAERFVRDPFSKLASGRMYRTGDLGRWRADGVIEFLGRNDRQVKIRGFRIELGEIESRLAQHSAVGSGVVLARDDVPGGRMLVAYVTTREPGAIQDLAARLAAYLSGVLPEYMVPARFVVLDTLPLTSSGKIDRQALPAPDTTLVQIDYVAPQTPAETKLVEICARLLQLPPQDISTRANFFSLGGHSLLLVKFALGIKSTFGVELPMRAIFAHPDVHSIARSLDALHGKSRVAVELSSLPESELEQIEV